MSKHELTMQEKCYLRTFWGKLAEGDFRAQKVYEARCENPGDYDTVRSMVFLIWFETSFQGSGRYLTTFHVNVTVDKGIESLRANGDAFYMPRVPLDCEEDYIGEKYVVIHDPKWERHGLEEKLGKLHELYRRDVGFAAGEVKVDAPELQPLFTTTEEMDAYIADMDVIKAEDTEQIDFLCRELGELWEASPVPFATFTEEFDSFVLKQFCDRMDNLDNWELLEYARRYFEQRPIAAPGDGTYRKMWKEIAGIWKDNLPEEMLAPLLAYCDTYIHDDLEPEPTDEEINRDFPKYFEEYCQSQL